MARLLAAALAGVLPALVASAEENSSFSGNSAPPSGSAGASVWQADSSTTGAAPRQYTLPTAGEAWQDWNQSFVETGEWIDDAFEGPVQYYFTADLLLAWGQSPGNTLVGSPEFAGLNFFPDAPNSFPHKSTGEFNDLFHYGARGRFGWDNADNSGVMVGGFAIFDKRQTRGSGQPYNGDIYSLSPLAGVPLDDGGDGVVVPFDSQFVQQYDQDLYGADVDLYLVPFFERNHFQAKLTVGAKFLQLHEQFKVQAADSGLGYVVNTTDNTIDYGTVTDIGIPPYQMLIYSGVTTRLVGPHIGLRYDFGNDQIRVWGHTKFALAANFTDQRLGGENVVNGFQASQQEGPPFYFTDSTTRVSPIFEQSVYADMYLFAMLPLLREIEFLHDAQFRIGFDYLLVGEVARPTNIIVYNTPTPALQGNRTGFELLTLSLGMTWMY